MIRPSDGMPFMSTPAPLRLARADRGWESSLLTFVKLIWDAFQTYYSALVRKCESPKEPVADRK